MHFCTTAQCVRLADMTNFIDLIFVFCSFFLWENIRRWKLGRWREMTSVSRAETIQRRKLELRGAQVYQVGGLLHLAIVDLYSENYGKERDDRAHVVVDFPAVFLIFLTFGFVMKHNRKMQIQSVEINVSWEGQSTDSVSKPWHFSWWGEARWGEEIEARWGEVSEWGECGVRPGEVRWGEVRWLR